MQSNINGNRNHISIFSIPSKLAAIGKQLEACNYILDRLEYK